MVWSTLVCPGGKLNPKTELSYSFEGWISYLLS
ncbi:hypothetical protein KP509_19G022000 [Ceratopteris richardii]|uniref:Uncharacterized protein n=1 Tax=Ceratopteris richardii TaxID=49495 RepID=A0A8T2SIF7_CERRI|nr:hypothetical protein KP509_19G022000 [Ceratopteris richardii]